MEYIHTAAAKYKYKCKICKHLGFNQRHRAYNFNVKKLKLKLCIQPMFNSDTAPCILMRKDFTLYVVHFAMPLYLGIYLLKMQKVNILAGQEWWCGG